MSCLLKLPNYHNLTLHKKWQNRSCQKGIIRLSNLESAPCEDLFKLLLRCAGVMTRGPFLESPETFRVTKISLYLQ